MNQYDQAPTYGMSQWERILITALGTITFFILSATITQVIVNSSRLSAVEARLLTHDTEMERFHQHLSEHRKITEKIGDS